MTDAELDHTIGLLLLRESTPLEVFATRSVLQALTEAFPLERILRCYAPLRWHEVTAGDALRLEGDRLSVTAFALGRKRPRYASHLAESADWVVGYRLEDVESGGVAVYAPCIECWTSELAQYVAQSACAFLDGTFWSGDEMVRAGAGRLMACEMGHLPISGPEGTAERLSSLRPRRAIYVHINNTNPVLDSGSPEYRSLADKGIEIGGDGMDLEV